MDMKDIKKEFSKRLQRVAREKNISQSTLATAFGKYRSEINRWFLGEVMPRPNTIEKLSTEIGCNFNYLAHGDGKPFSEKETKSGDTKIGKGATVISMGGDASNISTGNDPINLSPLEKEVILLNRSVGNEIYLRKLREKLLQIQEDSGNIF